MLELFFVQLFYFVMAGSSHCETVPKHWPVQILHVFLWISAALIPEMKTLATRASVRCLLHIEVTGRIMYFETL